METRITSLNWSEAMELFGTSLITLIVSATVLVIIGITLMIFFGLWVHEDARHKTTEPALWTLIVLLIPGFIGLIIYLLAGRDNSKESSGRYKRPLIVASICFTVLALFLIGNGILLVRIAITAGFY